jgi:hypothetical protein
MRVALSVLSLLFVAVSSRAADPVYLDELMETPVAKLQTIFTDLRKDGCYRIAPDRYIRVTIDKKDQKPWRVVLASAPPCRRAETGPAIDIRSRAGVELGQSQMAVIERIGRPETAAPAESDMRRFGDMEFFYVCRVSEGCARHTSIYFKDGVVSAISEWYSE